MDVRAIILVGADTEASTPTASQNTFVPEQLVGVPIAALDVVGQPVVCHVIDRLRNCGVSAVFVVSCVPTESAASLQRKLPAGVHYRPTSAADIWKTAESLFLQMSKAGTDAILVLRLGAYAEIDFNELLKFHFARHNCATSVANQFRQPLDVLVLDSGRAEEAAVVVRRRMHWHWRPSETFLSYGYFNALRHGRDFRNLAEDALTRKCALMPKAREIRPGVWLGKNVRLHDSVRVEGPVFIGERAKIKKGVILRGCSAIEDDCLVDTGTLIDSSTVLPHTYMGKNLNLAQAVAGFSQIVQVDRNVTVYIADERLTKKVSSASIRKTLLPVRSGLFLLKRALSANLARGYSRKKPLPGAGLTEEPSLKTARAHAAAASASTSAKRTEEEPV